MNVLERIHSHWVHGRRVRVLADHLSRLLPEDANVLDVGCGDGSIARAISKHRSDIHLTGAEVHIRPEVDLPIVEFDGSSLPFVDHSFDVTMLVDVLHHSDDPIVLLREACRVARKAILIKDHMLEGMLAGPILRLMDQTGNRRHGVAIPHNYWPRECWNKAFCAQGLHTSVWLDRLGLYPSVIGWPFERSLHFIALLEIPSIEHE